MPSGENYSYDSIGNFSSKGGVTYHYPSGGSQRPHAPDWVANSGNPYGYDANGNLTSADNGDRTYEYDVENHLAFVKAGGTAKHSMVYDGDGVLRKWTNDSNQTMLYVTPDYQLKLVSGVLSDVYVYYRFGGRGVAWHNNTDLCYLLSDHLSSTHSEVGGNQAEMGQRRYYPFGSDRGVSGASDIADEERFTSQHRMDAGSGGYPRRELYYYGARWYLPGVGIFTQPDTIVPDAKNPQALNRYAYVNNNPLKYVDPTGHEGEGLFDEYWVNEFREAHGGADPGEADYAYRWTTMVMASGMTQRSAAVYPGVDSSAAVATPSVGPDTIEYVLESFLPSPPDDGLPIAEVAGVATGAAQVAIAFGAASNFPQFLQRLTLAVADGGLISALPALGLGAFMSLAMKFVVENTHGGRDERKPNDTRRIYYPEVGSIPLPALSPSHRQHGGPLRLSPSHSSGVPFLRAPVGPFYLQRG